MRIALLALLCGNDRGATQDLEPALDCHAQALAAAGHSVVVLSPVHASEASDGQTWRAVAADVEQLVELPAAKLRRWLGPDSGAPTDELARAIERASRGLRALRRRLRDAPVDLVEVIGDPLAAAWLALGLPMPVAVRLVEDLPAGSPVGVAALRRRLAATGLRAAADVTVASHALRRRLVEQGVLTGGTVIPDGVALPDASPWPAVDTLRVFPLGPVDGYATLEGEPDALDLAIVPAPATARAPAAFFRALARGAVALIQRPSSLTEWIHDGHSALTWADAGELQRHIAALAKDTDRRVAIGRAARERIATRHAPAQLAERRLRHYALALERPAEALLYSPPAAPRNAEEFVIDGSNYFDVWWLSGGAETPIRLARDSDGVPALLQLTHPELRFVERILIGSWCEGLRRFDSPDWSRLRELEGRVVEHAEHLRREPDAHAPTSAPREARLAFPPIDHPMFQTAGECALLDELWRLEEHPGLVLWLPAIVHSRKTSSLARAHVHVRRLLVLAAQKSPGTASFSILRRLYRDKRLHAALVDDDRAFLARSRAADGFARGIEELGLHASLERAPYPKGRRRAARASASAEVTVLIPSYKHERYVVAAIESALRQRDVAVQVLVADDQSPDATVREARSLDDSRVQVIVHEERSGLGRSVEKALAMVQTPFVALLNSDDVFHPDRLAESIAVLNSDPGAQLVATRFDLVDSEARVLTPENASAVDLGPKALGWIRWFHRIVASELTEPSAWTDLGTLLRHNVLATSSNMVMRTPWLVQRIARARDLRYTLDWQLFLQACLEGGLRFVDRALLGYRLHDSNTVWFDQHTRTDYVLEVNRVVARVLAEWLEGAVRTKGTAAAAIDLARLLEGSVDQHGETDGMALFFADLIARVGESAIDPNAPAIEALANAAQRRHTLVQALREVAVDPWSIPWRLQSGAKVGLERETADGYLTRSRLLGVENLRQRESLEAHREQILGLEEQIASLRGHQTFLDQRIDTLREQVAQSAADLTTARAEHALADRAAQERLAQSETARLEAATATQREQAELSAKIAALEVERTRLLEQGRSLAVRLEAMESTLRSVERKLAASRAEHREAETTFARRLTELLEDRAALQTRLDGTIERADALADELQTAAAALRTERDDHVRTLARAEREAGEARIQRASRDSLAIAFAAEHVARQRQQGTLDARFSRLVLDKLRLRGPWKSTTALGRRAGSAVRLTTWNLARTLSGSNDLRGRLAVLAEPEPQVDSPSTAHTIADAIEPLSPWLLADARLTTPRAPWSPRSRPARVTMTDDAALARRDERYFARRQPAALDHLRALVSGDLGLLARMVRIARVQKSRGVRLCLARGLLVMAAAAHATERLCGTPYALLLSDDDLLMRGLPRQFEAAILASAAGFLVDSGHLAEEVARRTELRGRPMLIRTLAPSATLTNEVGRSAPADRLVVDCDRSDKAALGALVLGLHEAKRRGTTVTILLPRLPTSPLRAAAQCEFAARASARGLTVDWRTESMTELLATGAALAIAVHPDPARGVVRSIPVALALGTSALLIGGVAPTTTLALPALVHESTHEPARIARAIARLLALHRHRQVQHCQVLASHGFGADSTDAGFIEFCRDLVTGPSAAR